METLDYTKSQVAVIQYPLRGTLFVQGSAGCGKTSAGAARLTAMLNSGVPAQNILVLVPQRTLAHQYYDSRSNPNLPPGSLVDIFTFGGLAQRLVQVFWPMIAHHAGFQNPTIPPTFLNIETAQYYMARLVEPKLDQNYFDSISLDKSRIYSQILSNLNAAAAAGFPLDEIGPRLKEAWEGEPAQMRVYDEAQECALLFRQYCLDHNLLDFSLSLEVFCRHIWKSLLGRQFLIDRYRHLIYDNVEEDFPVAHDVIREWLPEIESAVLIHDSGGGYRSFLGADPHSAADLGGCCAEVITLDRSMITPPILGHFNTALTCALNRTEFDVPQQICSAVKIVHRQYFPQMIDWVSREITGLVLSKGARPGEIAVLAPYLTDSLRFALVNRLAPYGIPARSHRPSRALRDEPATQCLLTLARLAHGGWKLPAPSVHDVRHALIMSIQGLDLIRADLLARELYGQFRPFAQNLKSSLTIKTDKLDRITFSHLQRYEALYQWIMDYRDQEPVELDLFLSRLFGEVLSQPGFGFNVSYDNATTAARLIESVQNFRWSTGDPANPAAEIQKGKEYIQMVEEGVIGGQFLLSWADQPEDAVFLSPAYTFLVSNRPARFQFWLDIGSSGWWSRLDQPLTHPYVLSRSWPRGKQWTAASERSANLENLSRLAAGLVQRCGGQLYLCSTDFSEQGEEQQGQLVNAINKILRIAPDLLEEEPYV